MRGRRPRKRRATVRPCSGDGGAGQTDREEREGSCLGEMAGGSGENVAVIGREGGRGRRRPSSLPPSYSTCCLPLSLCRPPSRQRAVSSFFPSSAQGFIIPCELVGSSPLSLCRPASSSPLLHPWPLQPPARRTCRVSRRQRAKAGGSRGQRVAGGQGREGVAGSGREREGEGEQGERSRGEGAREGRTGRRGTWAVSSRPGAGPGDTGPARRYRPHTQTPALLRRGAAPVPHPVQYPSRTLRVSPYILHKTHPNTSISVFGAGRPEYGNNK